MFFLKIEAWKDWLLQVALSAVLGFVLLSPMWRLTFENAGRPLSGAEVVLLVFLSLVPFWIPQYSALRFYPLERRSRRWLLFVTSYFACVSCIFLLTLALTKRFPLLKVPRWIQIGVSFVLLEVIFFWLVQGYAVLVAELMNKIV